jgi:death-on-curing protein
VSEATPRWITKTLLLAIHGRLLAEHGGAIGLRDEGLLESALASPRNRFEYGETDVFELAAAYAFALTSNHPFVDGNKRAAFAAAGIFLELNGERLTASEADAVSAVLALSRADLSDREFAAWLRVNCEAI